MLSGDGDVVELDAVGHVRMPTIGPVAKVKANVKVTGFDHLVFVVADVERSLEWYCGFLGLEGVRVDEWRAGQAPFPSVRISEGAIIDFVGRAADGAAGAGAGAGAANVDHICLVVDPTD